MPPITLHILPPAFALPSISPSCITALAFLRYTLQYGTWIVIADAAEYPNHVAPFLVPAHHHLESVPEPIQGLDAIIQYVFQTRVAADLESHLDLSQQSQAVALASHLQLRLLPLVSLSLYACSENYSSAIRPSFATVLPFPESWILPSHLHKQALESCAHLGIDAKELSLLSIEPGQDKSQSLADAGPVTENDAISGSQSNEKSRLNIAAKLKLQKRIDDLVYAALAPFVSALDLPDLSVRKRDTQGSTEKAKPRWLFSSPTPTMADITAIALLSLAVLPYSSMSSASSSKDHSLVISFLPTSIHRQFPGLVSSYLLPAIEDAFAGKTSNEEALFSAPLATSAADEDEDDDGAFDDAVQGYGNLDIGSGKVEIPWRRKQKANSWESAQRIGNAVVPSSVRRWA